MSKAKWKFSLIVPVNKNNESISADHQGSNSKGQISCKKCGSLIFDNSLISDCPECGKLLLESDFP